MARPRNHWEALDLGLLISRRWYGLMLTSWLCLAAPVFLCCWILLPESPVLAIVIVWWLKPLYERLPLKILSSAIFGSVPSLRSALKEIRQCVLPGILSGLTFRRLSSNRSFTAPVLVLEALKGDVRQRRIEVLQPKAGSTAFWLTILSVHIEAFLVVGLVVGVYLFLPAELEIDWWGVIISGSSGEADWLMNAFMFAAMAVVAPVYVSAGFALYLNRRIELEAWDIELGFKRLAQRALGPMFVVPLLLVVCLSSSVDTHALVEKDPAALSQTEVLRVNAELESDTLSGVRRMSRDTINEVLAGADFHNETTTRIPQFLESLFEPGEEEPDAEEVAWVLDLFRFVAGIAEILLWVAVAVLVVWTAYRVRLLEKLGVFGRKGNRSENHPVAIMGLSVERESLPEDVMASAREVWHSGDRRSAISLIYRASLSALIHDFHCDFSEGDTEGDCLRKVSGSSVEVTGLFGRLTRMWLFAAYAHQMPPEEEFRRLCDEWPGVFKSSQHGSPSRAEVD